MVEPAAAGHVQDHVDQHHQQERRPREDQQRPRPRGEFPGEQRQQQPDLRRRLLHPGRRHQNLRLRGDGGPGGQRAHRQRHRRRHRDPLRVGSLRRTGGHPQRGGDGEAGGRGGQEAVLVRRPLLLQGLLLGPAERRRRGRAEGAGGRAGERLLPPHPARLGRTAQGPEGGQVVLDVRGSYELHQQGHGVPLAGNQPLRRHRNRPPPPVAGPPMWGPPPFHLFGRDADGHEEGGVLQQRPTLEPEEVQSHPCRRSSVPSLDQFFSPHSCTTSRDIFRSFTVL